jgi:hypothetical protein
MGRRCVYLFPFPISHVSFCSEGISDEKVRFLLTSPVEGMSFIMKVRTTEIS